MNQLIILPFIFLTRIAGQDTSSDFNEFTFKRNIPLAHREPFFIQEEVIFDYEDFIKGQDQENDSIDGLIIGDIEISKLFPSVLKIDVGPLFKDENGQEYLGYLGEYVLPYASNPDSLLALSFYLKKNFNLKNSIYDQLLRQCIILDSNYNKAIFLLAELRFKRGGYAEDAYFLMSLLKKHYPKNEEVNKIYDYFHKRAGGVDPLIPENFKDYLFTDYFYIIED